MGFLPLSRAGERARKIRWSTAEPTNNSTDNTTSSIQLASVASERLTERG